jgi:hypothetical protein
VVLLAIMGILLLSGCTTVPYTWPAISPPATTTPTARIEAPAKPAPSLEIVGQLGGQSMALSVDEGIALLGVGPRLVALDISEPAQPQLLGQSTIFPAVVQDIQIQPGGLGYLASGPQGLIVMDVSDPREPTQLAAVPLARDAQKVAVQDGQAALVGSRCHQGRCEGGLYLVDVTIPSAPMLVSSLEMPDFAYDVVIHDGVAFVAHGQGLTAVDISQPDQPIELDSIDLEGGSRAVTAGDGYVLAAGDGVWVLKTTNPSQLSQLGRFRSRLPVGTLAASANQAVLSEVFCELGLCGANLTVLDLTDLTRPEQVGVLGMGDVPTDMRLIDGQVLVATQNGGMRLVDIGRPQTPTLSSQFDILGGLTDVATFGTHMLASSATENALLVLDATEPLDIRATAEISDMRWARNVLVVDGLGYVPAWEDGLKILDLSDPTAPIRLGSFAAAELKGAAYAVALSRSPLTDTLSAVIAVGTTGLRFVDVADPNQPTQVGKLDLPGELWDVAAIPGLSADQATTALEPQPSSTLVAVGGTYDDQDRRVGILRVVDASNPDLPKEIAALPLPEEAWDVVVAGNMAYVATADCAYRVCSGGIAAVDLAVPEQPQLHGYLALPGGALSLMVDDGLAYLASGEYGLRLVNINDPTNLQLVAEVDTPGSVSRVVPHPRSPNILYVTDGSGGLLLLQRIER